MITVLVVWLTVGAVSAVVDVLWVSQDAATAGRARNLVRIIDLILGTLAGFFTLWQVVSALARRIVQAVAARRQRPGS